MPPLPAARRVQRIDAVIVAALVLAAAGSAIGVMTYEDQRGATLSVTWAAIVEELGAEPIQVSGNSQGELTLDVAYRNMTSALVRVTVSGTLVRAAPTAVLAELTVPGLNGTWSAEGNIPAGPPTSLTLEIPVEIGATPTVGSIRAASPADAAARLDAEHGSDLASGTWTLLVSIAPTAPGPLGGAEPYDVAAVAEIETYRAEIAADAPEVPR